MHPQPGRRASDHQCLICGKLFRGPVIHCPGCERHEGDIHAKKCPAANAR